MHDLFFIKIVSRSQFTEEAKTLLEMNNPNEMTSRPFICLWILCVRLLSTVICNVRVMSHVYVLIRFQHVTEANKKNCLSAGLEFCYRLQPITMVGLNAGVR